MLTKYLTNLFSISTFQICEQSTHRSIDRPIIWQIIRKFILSIRVAPMTINHQMSRHHRLPGFHQCPGAPPSLIKVIQLHIFMATIIPLFSVQFRSLTLNHPRREEAVVADSCAGRCLFSCSSFLSLELLLEFCTLSSNPNSPSSPSTRCKLPDSISLTIQAYLPPSMSPSLLGILTRKWASTTRVGAI